ncbi:MAG: FIST N-terminal domain-containing protein [Promethearchaeota archaeon]
MLNASVGMSTERDSSLAGKEAIKEALEGMNGKPKLCILAIDHQTKRKYDYNKVLKAVYSELDKDTLLIGSSVGGIMVNNRLAFKSVGTLLIEGDINIDAEFMYTKSRINYEQIADSLLEIHNNIEKKDDQVMIMFQDGPKFLPEVIAQQRSLNSRAVSLMSGLVNRIFRKQLEQFWEKGMGFPSTQELLEILFNNGWEIPIIGNLATNPEDFQSYEFYKDQVLEDAFLGAIISGTNNTKLAYGFTQGAKPTGISCTPTKKIGNFILKIDGKPALKGFCNAFNIEKDIFKELETQGYLNYYHVFGNKEEINGKEYYHLTLTLTDPELENLIISGFPFNKVPEKIELFMSSSSMVLNSAVEIIKNLKNKVTEPKFLFGIDCVLRWSSMGDNLDKYIESIRSELGKDVPLFMVGAGGEVYGSKGHNYYQNNMTFIPLLGGK